MTSDLQRIAQGLVDCLDQVPQVVAYLRRMAHRCREQAGFVADVAGGNSSVRNAATLLEDAANRCEEAAHLLQQAALRARGWAEQMISGARVAGPSSTPESMRPAAPAGEPATGEGRREKEAAKSGVDRAARPGKVSDEEAARVFQQLPERIPKPGHRPKTRGIWVDADGQDSELVSGNDRHQEMAEALAARKGLGRQPPAKLAITSHVEVKFAIQMRERGLRDETIVINKPPCTGGAGCDDMLPYFLPDGATLTVYGPDGFKKTYRGRSDVV